MGSKQECSQYNVVGKMLFSAVPWNLLKRGDAPKGVVPVWAFIQRRNYFANLKWPGIQVLQGELQLPEAEVRAALQWLAANGFVAVDKSQNQVTVVIGTGEVAAENIEAELDGL